jgi:hypothetical protein
MSQLTRLPRRQPYHLRRCTIGRLLDMAHRERRDLGPARPPD